MTQRTPLYLSLHESVRHWATYQPEKPALITEREAVSYQSFGGHVARCENSLLEQHLPRQTKVAILVESKTLFLAALCGVVSSGHTAVVLNLGLQRELLLSMIADANCGSLIVDEAGRRLISTHASSIPIVFLHNSNNAPAVFQPSQRFVDDQWAIIYSSGTTGTPKGIVRSDLSIAAELLSWCLEIPINKGSTVFVGRPLFYTGGLVMSAAALLVGGTAIVPTEWSPAIYAQLLRDHKINLAFFIPDQIKELTSNYALLSSCGRPERILTMGAPITPEMKRHIRDHLTSAYIESWGNSEGLGTITSPSDVDERPTSIGRPFLTDAMWIVDEQGMPLPAGMTGRITGRADSVLSEYHNRNDLNAALITGKAVISEDLGYQDSSGYFYLVGRVTQRIVRAGMPIFATDIERKLAGAPGVSQIVVVGIPDPEEGEVPVAALVQEDGVHCSNSAWLAVLNQRLTASEYLRFVSVCSALPRNAAGKVDLSTVRQILISQATGGDSRPAGTGL